MSTQHPADLLKTCMEACEKAGVVLPTTNACLVIAQAALAQTQPSLTYERRSALLAAEASGLSSRLVWQDPNPSSDTKARAAIATQAAQPEQPVVKESLTPQQEQTAAALGQWLTAIGELYAAMGYPAFDAQTPTDGVVETLKEAANRLAQLEKERTARQEAQRELERFKGLLAAARVNLMRELKELGWVQQVQAQGVPHRLLQMVLDDMAVCYGEGGADYEFKELSTETVEALDEYRAAPQAALQAPEPTTWSRYVAGMIGAYLGWPVDDDRIEAVAGIIERRRWAQEKALETPSKLTEEQHVAAVKVLLRANGLDGLPQRMLDAMLAAAPTPTPETCSNCDTPAPGCEGLFASEGKACKFHGVEGTKP